MPFERKHEPGAVDGQTTAPDETQERRRALSSLSLSRECDTPPETFRHRREKLEPSGPPSGLMLGAALHDTVGDGCPTNRVELTGGRRRMARGGTPASTPLRQKATEPRWQPSSGMLQTSSRSSRSEPARR